MLIYIDKLYSLHKTRYSFAEFHKDIAILVYFGIFNLIKTWETRVFSEE